ncbi:DUF1642 domain-containing protein [Lactococcus lactis]|uniref:DUF1642 domain-containing protein n=1 Tax=Lactococcus lactis TaxID=1358 RepID=UPI0023A962B4|nr:DUF1642 domain-containing protein [Lactococcus lactis]WEA55139.1 DUF1642 domain-containing protein [Lactococcus lactis]
MTKFEEEVKRPDNGPLTELNNNMQEVFSQYRKMRQYADYLEYELKQKDEHILKLENENSFLRDEHTTFDSNGNSVEPLIQQQALPVVPEDVAKLPPFDDMKEYVLDERLLTIREFLNKLDDKSNNDITEAEAWCLIHEDIVYRAMLDGYTVEKPQLFYLKNKLTRKYLRKSKHTKDDWNEDFDKVETVNNKTKFTQQEIGRMETGSYEQIEVAE